LESTSPNTATLNVFEVLKLNEGLLIEDWDDVAFVNPTFLTNDRLALLDELDKGQNAISRKNIKKAINNLLEQSICVIVILLDHKLLDFIVSEFNLYPPFFLV
jgi:hypothetical protein